MGGIWSNSLFLLPFKLAKREVLICSRYVDADSQRYSCKNLLQIYAANLHKEVTAGVFRHKLNGCSFHCTTDCATLIWLTKLQREFLDYTLLHIQPEVLTLEHLKCLNKVSKSLNALRSFKSHKFWKMKLSCIPKILWYLLSI